MKYFLTVLILAVTTTSASAITAVCADRDIMVERLDGWFNETVVASISLPSSAIIEVYASPEFNTWTIAVIEPKQNLLCKLADGEGAVSYKEYIDLLESGHSI